MTGYHHLRQQVQRPNFFIFIVDEQRYPTVYENHPLKEWHKENFKTQELLRNNGKYVRRTTPIKKALPHKWESSK